jgi:TolB-like protein/Tfp pilus assembly protein PilF
VTDPSRAVFVSYASQDAAAAQRICSALRAAGIEVWFDQSELRGGDAWDQKIRRELADCALFLPVISANTVARHEGYFRLEWNLADQRTQRIARNRAFIVPVCVDDTPRASTDAPESFQRVQWTRLPDGETSSAFVAHIRGLLSGQAPAASPSPSADGADASLPRRPLRAVPVAIALAFLGGVAYLALDKPWIAKPPPATSIAVLPLANEGGDASQQYFSDGISEDLITALAQFPGLKVIGRTSAFLFRNSKEDSRSIGVKLGVAHLLEGSVRRVGDIVRVSAELIDTADGSTQWSERYDRPYKEIFALQDEITRAVSVNLRGKLLPGEHAPAQSDRPPSGNVEAYNAMLQGWFYQLRRSEPDLRRAIEFHERATALDADYALAWSRLSGAWTTLGSNFLGGAAAQEAYAKAREAANRALALAPDSAAAHLALGGLLENADLNWRDAQREYRRAAVLAPNNGNAAFALAAQAATFGDPGAGARLLRQALSTDPLRASWYNSLSVMLSGMDRLDEAEQAVRRAIELQPATPSPYYQLTVIMVQRGQVEAALASAQRGPPGVWQDIALTLARQIGSDQKAADDTLKTLIDQHGTEAPFQIAQIYALRRDPGAMFTWLDRARASRDGGMRYLLYDPFIGRFTKDERFAPLCRAVGLPVPGELTVRRDAGALAPVADLLRRVRS